MHVHIHEPNACISVAAAMVFAVFRPHSGVLRNKIDPDWVAVAQEVESLAPGEFNPEAGAM